jgi:hypothetical protein
MHIERFCCLTSLFLKVAEVLEEEVHVLLKEEEDKDKE